VADLRNDDTDIDALMGSVVAHNGQIVEFPAAPERKRRAAAIRSASTPTDRVESLSAELAAELDANEPRPVVDPRTVPVRFSNLKHMARSALHYWDAVQLDRQDTLAMRLGRGAHAMVLGMPVVKWVGKTRNGKAWDAFKAQHVDKEILNGKEWAAAEGIALAIRRHPIAAPILFENTTLEEQIEWEFLGRKCTSRPDARRASAMVCDLKTTQCAEPKKFERDSMYRGYNAQLAFYEMAIEHATGTAPSEVYVVAVESKRPFAITVLQLTDEARESGRRLCRQWFERLLVCEASNAWPAYVDSIAQLNVPGDGDPDNAIDLDNLDEELFA
jgi:hypothetical protein